MPKLHVFNNVSLDGYFVDGSGSMGWAHQNPNDAEWSAFVSSNASGGGALLFGRITYELMASFWPTPMAMQQMPAVAKRMNEMPKYVFSRTLRQADWSNTTILREAPAVEMRKLKSATGPDLTILGSGSIVAQLAAEGLIDSYMLAIHPKVLGTGRTLFEGLKAPLGLSLKQSRGFNNGCLVVTYEPNA